MVGREVEVLYEKPGRQPGQMVGKSGHLHAVHVEDTLGRIGEMVRVRISASASNSLAGEVISRLA
jgi:tRNA-2-methylthio-N6-dimethylallyladenosine synthase